MNFYPCYLVKRLPSRQSCQIPLDIFLKNQHNKGKVIDNLLDAWLLFFSSDDPEDILNITQKYPKFQVMYEQAYQICRNVEDVMGIFSEELRMLDRNTVQLMIDDMQKTIDTQGEELVEKNEQLAQKDEQLTQKDEQLTQKDEQLTQKNEQLAQKDEQLTKKDEQLSEKDAIIAKLQEALKKLEGQ